jgi:hypothetical protein
MEANKLDHTVTCFHFGCVPISVQCFVIKHIIESHEAIIGTIGSCWQEIKVCFTVTWFSLCSCSVSYGCYHSDTASTTTKAYGTIT